MCNNPTLICAYDIADYDPNLLAAALRCFLLDLGFSEAVVEDADIDMFCTGSHLERDVYGEEVDFRLVEFLASFAVHELKRITQ